MNLLRQVGFQNGFEAWRLLHEGYQAMGPTKLMLWRAQLNEVSLTGSESDLEARLIKLELDISEFERQTCIVFSREDLIGKLLIAAHMFNVMGPYAQGRCRLFQ